MQGVHCLGLLLRLAAGRSSGCWAALQAIAIFTRRALRCLRLPSAVLAIGGVGGLAVGLAGREILENLFTGLIILSSNPFEVRRRTSPAALLSMASVPPRAALGNGAAPPPAFLEDSSSAQPDAALPSQMLLCPARPPHPLPCLQVGDEVLFRPSSGQVVEGIVVDVGWYRTTIRSFEREIYMIPNSGVWLWVWLWVCLCRQAQGWGTDGSSTQAWGGRGSMSVPSLSDRFPGHLLGGGAARHG